MPYESVYYAKKCSYYAQEMCLLWSRNVHVLIMLKQEPVIHKKYAYYAQEIFLHLLHVHVHVCLRNVPIYYAQERSLLCSNTCTCICLLQCMLKKCSRYYQEMCILCSRNVTTVDPRLSEPPLSEPQLSELGFKRNNYIHYQ